MSFLGALGKAFAEVTAFYFTNAMAIAPYAEVSPDLLRILGCHPDLLRTLGCHLTVEDPKGSNWWRKAKSDVHMRWHYFFFCIRTLSFWIMGRKFVPPFLRSSQPLQSHEPLFHNKPLSVSLYIWHWFHLLEGLYHVLLCDFSFNDNEYIPIHPNRALSTDHRSWVYLDELMSLLWLLPEA